jgi:hypothetical protein
MALLTCLLPACSSGPECAGLPYVDQGVDAGMPTAGAVLDQLLADHPKWVDQTGWTVGFQEHVPNRTITFVTDDGDKVEVGRSALNNRWYLDSYRGCRTG